MARVIVSNIRNNCEGLKWKSAPMIDVINNFIKINQTVEKVCSDTKTRGSKND